MPTAATLKAMQEEKRVLEELATVNQMTIRKLENERDAKSVLPEETLDMITRLENTLKLEKQNNERLQKEHKLLETQLKRKEKDITKAASELDDVKRETGWVKGVTLRKEEREAKHNENKIAELQLMLQKLEEEQRTNKLIQRKKTQLIETLSKELESKTQFEEDLLQAQNILKVKEKEIKDADEELQTLKKIHAKKDKIISTMEQEKDDVHLRQLEGDKRFLQAEISKHTEMKRQHERTIKAQQTRQQQLTQRLDSIVQALKDLKLERHLQDRIKGALPAVEEVDIEGVEPNTVIPENEGIDAAVYDLLQRDLDSLRNYLNLKDVIIQEKDTNIEALENKVEILDHSKRMESKSIHAERKDAASHIDDLKRTMDMQQDIFKKQNEELKRENVKLRKHATPALA